MEGVVWDGAVRLGKDPQAWSVYVRSGWSGNAGLARKGSERRVTDWPVRFGGAGEVSTGLLR